MRSDNVQIELASIKLCERTTAKLCNRESYTIALAIKNFDALR